MQRKDYIRAAEIIRTHPEAFKAFMEFFKDSKGFDLTRFRASCSPCAAFKIGDKVESVTFLEGVVKGIDLKAGEVKVKVGDGVYNMSPASLTKVKG